MTRVMVQQLEDLLFLERTGLQFPAFKWLTTLSNSSSKRPKVLFWPPPAPGQFVVSTHIHSHIMLFWFLVFFFLDRVLCVELAVLEFTL